VSNRTIRVGLAVFLLGVGLVTVRPSAAAARSTYCSPSGDLCYAARGKGVHVRLRITLIADFFRRYRLCVTAPDGTRRCKRFRLHRIEHGMFDSTIRWARHFPFRGPGSYRARWRHAGVALGPVVDFAEGPSIRVKPARVRAGARVRVFGLAGGCAEGNQVTLMSEAFPDGQEFAGVPAVFAPVGGNDSYSTRVTIPAQRTPGRYTISARCGGGNFGVTRALTVLPAG
jgi:hypothetical protein